jgi:DNA-binding IscR family transcriptional regulator
VHVSSCTIKQVLSGLNEQMNLYLRKFTLADMIPQVQGAGNVQQHS